MNEHQFGNKVRQVLNQGTRLDARTLERLRQVRERALERRRVSTRASALGAREPALAFKASAFGRFGGLGGFSFRLLLPAAALVAGLIAIYSWQQDQRAADLEEMDAQLLADDLPMDAYLDRGFETWLKKAVSR